MYDYCKNCNKMWCGTGGCIAFDPAWIMEKEPERFAEEYPKLNDPYYYMNQPDDRQQEEQ